MLAFVIKILPSYTSALRDQILPTIYCPQVHASFTSNEDLDWTIIHRRLDHITDEKLATMCARQLLQGLPLKFPMYARIHKRDCWICPKGRLHHDHMDLQSTQIILDLGN